LTDLPLVAVPGGRVEYLDVPGDPGRAPLLFLHEGLGSVRLWRGWPEAVAAATGRRVVAYSRLGHGCSDLPPAPPRASSPERDEGSERAATPAIGPRATPRDRLTRHVARSPKHATRTVRRSGS